MHHRKSAIVSFLFLFMFSSFALYAAGGTGVKQLNDGIKAYELGQFKEAIVLLEYSLDNSRDLVEEDAELANYYYAKSLIGAFHQAADKAELEVLFELQHAYSLAETHFLMSGNLADHDLQNLPAHFINGGITLVNYVREKPVMEVLAYQLLETAVKYTDEAIELSPQNYIAFDVRGQAYYALRKEEQALKDFKHSLQLYRTDPPKQADLMMAYTYYRIGLIYAYDYEDVDKALAYIGQGLHALHREWNEVKMCGYDVKDLALQREAEEDLVLLELDLLIKTPDKSNVALQRFEWAMNEFPDNYFIQLGYANVLESHNFDKAVLAYKHIIEKNPSRSTAYYNLGLLYVQASIASHELMSRATNSATVILYQRQLQGYLREGQIWMEQALEIEPNDPEIVGMLVQITGELGSSKHQQYLQLQKQLTGN